MDVAADNVTAAVVELAAERDPSQMELLLEALDGGQLRTVAAALAVRIARDQRLGTEISGPDQVCEVAIAAAASTFGTTPDAVLSPARAQEVCDARAVAMSAARSTGLSVTRIAAHFDKDHGSVLHALKRTTQRPRLAAAAATIAEDIDGRYQAVTEQRAPLRLVPEAASPVAPPTVEELSVVGAAINAAAGTFATDPQLLRGMDRTRTVSDARAVAMTAARISGLSLPKIAAEFGDRHHTVVLQSTRRIQKTPPLLEIAERIAAELPGQALPHHTIRGSAPSAADQRRLAPEVSTATGHGSASVEVGAGRRAQIRLSSAERDAGRSPQPHPTGPGR